MHVQELNRLRASRKLDGREGNASHGTENLQGAPVMATDLRASVSLVIAALLSCYIGGKGGNNRQSCLSS